jgi:hypothetical protein
MGCPRRYSKLRVQTLSTHSKITSKMASNHTILYHGNCIDGWFSAYIAHSALQHTGTVNMFPISPSQTNTWPKAKEMAGTHILLVDVSVAQNHRDAWIAAGALSVNCIDHHASAVEHWPAGACPINTAACAALQTWQHFYPTQEVPFWLHHIDRIDRWDNPTYEDRCVREVLNEIAHKPVQKKTAEAFTLTQLFLANMSTPLGVMMTISQGKQILDGKDAALLSILAARGTFHTFTPEYIAGWSLPQTWLGANVFIIDNTNITLDTTEAAHIVFQHYPQVNVFINYRKKTLYGKPVPGGAPGADKEMYVYSARSRGFNLTDGTILKGHPTAAGASLIKGEAPMLPFLLAAA